MGGSNETEVDRVNAAVRAQPFTSVVAEPEPSATGDRTRGSGAMDGRESRWANAWTRQRRPDLWVVRSLQPSPPRPVRTPHCMCRASSGGAGWEPAIRGGVQIDGPGRGGASAGRGGARAQPACLCRRVPARGHSPHAARDARPCQGEGGATVACPRYTPLSPVLALTGCAGRWRVLHSGAERPAPTPCAQVQARCQGRGGRCELARRAGGAAGDGGERQVVQCLHSGRVPALQRHQGGRLGRAGGCLGRRRGRDVTLVP